MGACGDVSLRRMKSRKGEERRREAASFADQIGETDAAKRVAEEMEARNGGQRAVELGDALQVADGVLREAEWPAADKG